MLFNRLILATAVATASMAITTTPARAGTDAYIGEILVGGSNYCPRGTARADGQLLAINTNQSLFSLYGTTYGGDGTTTFKLPDLRGRVALHDGTGPGLSTRILGTTGGTETTTMTSAQMPAHIHLMTLETSDAVANTTDPRGASFGRTTTNAYVGPATTPVGRLMHLEMGITESQGGGQAQNNMQPYQVVMYCVALVGVFPSRN